MPDIRNEGLPKKVLPILYVIDTSGSMAGDKIATVNEAMHECEEILREKAGENADAEIKIGALKFSSGAQWVTKSGLVALEDFYWNDVDADGMTDLGAAIKELDAKLSRNAFLVSDTGFCLPVLIFMSDGGPNDDWERPLRNANAHNKWFQRARKIAIAIGDDADKDVLRQLVGNVEAVVQANDLNALKNLIVRVSVSASMMASSSRMVGDEADGGAILSNAMNNMDGDATVMQSSAAPAATTSTNASLSADTLQGWGSDDGDWN